VRNSTIEKHWTIAPIRTYEEVLRIMEPNDPTLTRGTIWHIEQRALAKLRAALEDMEDKF